MRIHYSGADPSGDSGCTELLSSVAVLNRNKQAASAISYLWMLSQRSMLVSECSHWAVRSTKIRLPSRDRWNVPGVVDLIRSLILLHELEAKIKSNTCPFGLNRMYFGSNPKACSSLRLPTEAIATM